MKNQTIDHSEKNSREHQPIISKKNI